MDCYKMFPEIHDIISRDRFYMVRDEITATYNCVPYHSGFHGNDVMLFGYRLLSHSTLPALKEMPAKDILTFILALLGHDAGHPGLGNHAELARIRAMFPTATSPLEEFHYLQTRDILMKFDIPFNASLLYQIILATDPCVSIETTSSGFPEHLRTLVPLVPLIKLADVNHTVSFFSKHLEWTWKLEDELGITMTPTAQMRFLETYVMPLLAEAHKIVGLEESLYSELRMNLKRNIEYWEYKLEMAK